MHPAAFGFVERLNLSAPRVVEIGSRNVNGTVRDCIRHDEWTGVDVEAGDGVDWVGDFADWPGGPVELVVSTEVLEHAPDVNGLLDHAADVLVEGGWLVVTCATTGRTPHSAVDGGPVRDGEHYRNVIASELLDHPRFVACVTEVHEDRGDLYYLGRLRGDS
jgi:SAM-dependent methyltransferase